MIIGKDTQRQHTNRKKRKAGICGVGSQEINEAVIWYKLYYPHYYPQHVPLIRPYIQPVLSLWGGRVTIVYANADNTTGSTMDSLLLFIGCWLVIA